MLADGTSCGIRRLPDTLPGPEQELIGDESVRLLSERATSPEAAFSACDAIGARSYTGVGIPSMRAFNCSARNCE